MYKFITLTDKNTGAKKIMALSTYAGKTIKGVAKQNPGDEFNEETGRDLAVLRCDEKVADKRAKNALRKLREAELNLELAQIRFDKMVKYVNDTQFALAVAGDAVDTFLKNLSK